MLTFCAGLVGSECLGDVSVDLPDGMHPCLALLSLKSTLLTRVSQRLPVTSFANRGLVKETFTRDTDHQNSRLVVLTHTTVIVGCQRFTIGGLGPYRTQAYSPPLFTAHSLPHKSRAYFHNCWPISPAGPPSVVRRALCLIKSCQKRRVEMGRNAGGTLLNETRVPLEVPRH